MVLKRKVDYGFRGFQVPFVPRFPRSVRRRSASKKPAKDGRAYAFEILASVAGKLLLEGESSASSNASEGNHQPAISQGVVEKGSQDKVRPLKAEEIHRGSSVESIFISEAGTPKSGQKRLEHAETDCVLECISNNNNNNFDCWGKDETDVKSEIFKLESKFGHHSHRLSEVPEESSDGNVKNGFRVEHGANGSGLKKSYLDNKFSVKDQLELCVNSPALIDTKNNVNSPYCRKLFPNISFPRNGNDIKLGFRDDDEKLLRCKKVCTKPKAFRSPQLIARRKLRKMLAYKYWKAAPKLKDYEYSRSEEGVKPLYDTRKIGCRFERSQHNTLFKRRKFFDRGSVLTSDGGFSSDSVSNLPKKGMDRDSHRSSSKLHVSKDSHVKFSIKSFKIPELYIDVPETATVGSLKRTVMEAVMTLLGSGMHVGVLVQGKKVRDDNRTLLQTGICRKEKLNKLGFTLEPNSIQDSPADCLGDPSQCETSQPIRSPETPVQDSGTTHGLQDLSLPISTENFVESNHERTTSPTDTIADITTPDSRVLVAVPPRSPEALATVPVSQKTKRLELVQRRTRRPFSVSEVEALVEAVEELGTGRWRDVKLRAFENADHRTYVDLKDKWKTLVHTAKISPQQRRGEPVPQDLLNRVLTAHAYWCHHQAKQHGHGKNRALTMKTPEASAEELSVGAVQPLVII
ncbi:hypothetical protein HN51_050090 [Arachis hypogaea]|uniref:Uncharacterized protein n=1 Tax=Arachis hypogaea TaxID=3818 RepID=A0A444YCS5_ARAHY|nr:telomere repeat-binding protein 3 [Arachis hypogaea]XP_025669019.1 telomere repeat-binding protein 3 [Arachis hypogaea]QHN91746.1 Telomere repeat-binding protein [Arachis hypogaea]QHN91747.1 Telomere repeat-binding protein [Arachis hypogaea]RYQ99719.1 hypothetical protein Ahy_B07g087706 isoform B [Arachis hypogaea]